MKKLPVLLVATTGLIASMGASAQLLPNDAAPFAVNIPNLKSGFEFNIEGLFLKPSNSDLDYGIVNNTAGTPIISNILTVKPDTDAALGAGLGYVFPDSGNDVQLNWTEFSHTDSDAFRLPPESVSTVILTPSGDAYGATSNATNEVVTASAHARFKLEAVDLDAGQYVDIGNRLQARLSGGLRFAQLENNLSARYTDTYQTEHGANSREQNTALNSKFNGIGPRLGFDANYNLGANFAVMGHAATALLVGKVDADSVSSRKEGEDLTPIRLDSPKVTRVVPALDARLGLNYNYTLDCDSVVTLEGGYKVTQYIDVTDRLRGFDGSGSRVVTRTTSSVGFSGPYVKLAAKL